MTENKHYVKNLGELGKHQDKFLFIPLGGANEVGMNLNLYHHDGADQKGKWLIVDMGIGFAEDCFPGVDITLPKITFLEQHKDEIAGLVLTHAHEDHIGAVPYLWNRIKCPIYALPFTAEILTAKFKEMDANYDVPITIIAPNKQIQIGNFSIEMIYITHSIPEMHGVMIRTPSGNIFHTGDWKLDKDPVVGEPTNEARLKELGDEGVLAMVSDSTNIFNPGSSRSEGELRESLIKLISKYDNGLVVVTTFASNIARIHSIATAAKAVGRKVVLAGRSLWRMYEAAKKTGYLSDIDHFMEPGDIKGKKREDLLVICTGCQGEEMAAVNRIVEKTHPYITMNKGDTIIFASKIIPGNDKRIFSLFNKFSKMGVEVLSEMNEFVHVSGHPAQDEVQRMYELIRPRVAIPVHGDTMRLHLQAKFAASLGVKHTVEVENGSIVLLDHDHPGVVGHAVSGYLAIDGKYVIDGNSAILKERIEMEKNGVVFIVVTIDYKEKKPRYIKIFAPGILDYEKDEEFIKEISEFVKKSYSNLKNDRDRSMNKKVALKVKNLIKKERGKLPKVHVHVA